MVITAGGDECRLRPATLHQLKTEHAAIEIQRAFEIRDFEMNVADADAGIDRWCAHSARLCRRFTNERGHSQCRDAVARSAQNLKTKAVEREALSRLRD